MVHCILSARVLNAGLCNVSMHQSARTAQEEAEEAARAANLEENEKRGIAPWMRLDDVDSSLLRQVRLVL